MTQSIFKNFILTLLLIIIQNICLYPFDVNKEVRLINLQARGTILVLFY